LIGAVGQVVLLRFPRTDLAAGKLRPVLVLARLPGRHEDWLVCMLSSRVHQAVAGFDEAIAPGDDDFAEAGLKVASIARLARLAAVEGAAFEGLLGSVAPARVSGMRARLAEWLLRDEV
jgi:mRNA interferase MazF